MTRAALAPLGNAVLVVMTITTVLCYLLILLAVTGVVGHRYPCPDHLVVIGRVVMHSATCYHLGR